MRLAGGLGNQLFQLATSFLLSQRSGVQTLVLAKGLSLYKTKRSATSLEFINSPLIIKNSPRISLFSFLALYLRIGRLDLACSVNDININYIIKSGKVLHAQLPFFMDGYFQDCLSYPDIVEFSSIVDYDFLKGIDNFGVLSGASSDCVIHIRGGDFLAASDAFFLNPEYYRKSVVNEYNYGSRVFHVVTDDIFYAQWIISSIPSLPDSQFTILPTSSDPLIDFSRLVFSPRLIIGNSTFAWWAAALSPNICSVVTPGFFVHTSTRNLYLPQESVLDLK